jgi:hypothetical protein
LGHGFDRNVIDFRQFLCNQKDVSRLVALSAMGHGRQVGGVRFQDEAFQGREGEIIAYIRIFIGHYPVDTQHELGVSENFFQLIARAAEAVENAAEAVDADAVEAFEDVGKGVAGVDGYGEVLFDAPEKLLLKSLDLLAEESAVPMQVDADFADGDKGVCVQHAPQSGEEGGVIGAYVGGVEAQHGEALSGVGAAEGQELGEGFQIDARQAKGGDPGFGGAEKDFGAIGIEGLEGEMGMGIN